MAERTRPRRNLCEPMLSNAGHMEYATGPHFSAPNLWIVLSPSTDVVDPSPSKMGLLDVVADPYVVIFEFAEDGSNLLMHFCIIYGL